MGYQGTLRHRILTESKHELLERDPVLLHTAPNVNPVSVKTMKIDERHGILKCLLLNARSLMNKREELDAVVYEKNPDIILVTETWAKEKHSKGEVNLNGYDCHRNDRVHTERGGGCIIYAKVELKTVLLEKLTTKQNTDTVWLKYEDITIGVCYNTTANSVEQEEPLLEVIREACRSNGETVVTGDFNHETIDWELMEAGVEGQTFLEATEDLFLIQHVKEPTRESNILDLILSSNPNQIQNVKIAGKLGNSDHNMVEFDLIVREKPTEWRSKYRNYRKANYQNIRHDMEQSEFIHENNTSTERLWSNLKEKIKEVVEKHIPLKERVVGKHPKPMWWNRKIYRLRKNRLKWWHRYNERKRKKDENKYLHYQREVTKEIRKAKRKLEKR